MISTQRRYGWRRDRPDQRDLKFHLPRLASLPSHVDLRAKFPACYDQGALGSCTANAIAGAVQYARRVAGEDPDFVPSRLFIYFNERLMEGTRLEDSGAPIRTSVQTVVKHGVCPEFGTGRTSWAYEPHRFADMPNDECYVFGRDHQAIEYRRVAQSYVDLRTALAAGYPVVFGFAVYESFESDEVAASGGVPMPSYSEASMGGHAVLAVGYDDPSHRFIVRNSWGAGWGDRGYCYMPYQYLLSPDLAADFWTVSKVEA